MVAAAVVPVLLRAVAAGLLLALAAVQVLPDAAVRACLVVLAPYVW